MLCLLDYSESSGVLSWLYRINADLDVNVQKSAWCDLSSSLWLGEHLVFSVGPTRRTAQPGVALWTIIKPEAAPCIAARFSDQCHQWFWFLAFSLTSTTIYLRSNVENMNWTLFIYFLNGKALMLTSNPLITLLPQWLSHYTLSSHWLQDQLSPVVSIITPVMTRAALLYSSCLCVTVCSELLNMQ